MSSEKEFHTICVAVSTKPANNSIGAATRTRKDTLRSLSALSFSFPDVLFLCLADAVDSVFILCPTTSLKKCLWINFCSIEPRQEFCLHFTFSFCEVTVGFDNHPRRSGQHINPFATWLYKWVLIVVVVVHLSIGSTPTRTSFENRSVISVYFFRTMLQPYISCITVQRSSWYSNSTIFYLRPVVVHMNTKLNRFNQYSNSVRLFYFLRR